MSSSSDRRDLSIAEFFTALTELVNQCLPLVKAAVAEQTKKDAVRRTTPFRPS